MKKNKCRILAWLMALALFASVLPPVEAQAAKKKAAADVTIDVTEYGAKKDTGEDNAEAIIKAVEAAKKESDKGKSVVINFPKGRYDIYPDKIPERELYVSNTVGDESGYKNKKIGILIEDMDNVTVEGNGSLFMFHGKMTTFATINSKNVTFHDFKVDFQTPTVVDVTVEKRDSNSVTVYVPECYNYQVKGNTVKWISDVSPYTKKPYWEDEGKMDYTQRFDTKSGLTWRGDTGANHLFNGLARVTDVGNHRLKFTYSGTPHSELQPGLCYQMRRTKRDHPGTFFWKSKDVTLKDLDIHFLHGFGMVGQHSDTLTLSNVDFEVPLKNGRTSAGYADFVQMSGCKGMIDIHDCTFSNPHDDPINVHGTFNEVKEVKDGGKTFVVQYMHHETAGFPNFFKGDTIEFTRKDTLLPVEGSRREVVSVKGPDGQGGNMPDGGTNNLKRIEITLDSPVSGITAHNFVVENITYTPSVKIYNNVFKETPTRGILVTTMKPVVIENNVFDGLGMSGISISNDAQNWRESGRTEDVIIRKNVFTRGKDNAIYVCPTNPDGSAETIHKNMRITENTFFMENQHVLNAKSVGGLTFSNNTIYRQEPNVTWTEAEKAFNMNVGEKKDLNVTANSASLNKKLYILDGCHDVKIENNVYDARVNAGSQLKNGTTEADVKIVGDELVLNKDNQTDAGIIGYTSSDENIAKVSSSGVVTAVGKGEAEITPYLLEGGRKFPGTPVKVTVEAGEAVLPDGIEITTTTEKTEEATVEYKATVKGKDGCDQTVKWSVVDPQTGGKTNRATIDPKTGVLTPKASGAVEVVASTVNGLEARKLLSIQMGTHELADGFSVENEVKDKWSVSGEDKITIQAQNSGLWATQQAKNLFGSSLGTKDDVEAVIKMDGKTKNGWDEAGLIFYSNGDNYVSIERKHGNNSPSIKVVNEVEQSANEDDEGGAKTCDAESIYLKLEKKGDKIIGSFSTDKQTWTRVKEVTNAALGSNFKIGFLTGSGTHGSDTPFTFSELTVDGKAVKLTQNSNESLPKVNSATLTYDAEKNLATASYEPKETKAIVKWAVADTKDGNYSVLEGLVGAEMLASKELKGKHVKAAVIPVKDSGASGDIVWSAPQEMTGEGADQSDVKSANAYLESATIDGLSAAFAAFVPKTYHYFTTATADETSVTAAFKAQDEKATVKVLFNGKEIEGTEGTMNLTNARNLIEVQVTAEDGVTVNNYRFAMSRTGDMNTNLESLTIDGENILVKDVDEYVHYVDKVKTVKVQATAASKNATVEIFANGQKAEGGNVSLQPGNNDVIVRVSSETSAQPKYYKVNIKTPKLDNADLYSIELAEGSSLSPAFDPATLEYTATSTISTFPFMAIAEEQDAKVEVFHGDTLVARDFHHAGTDLKLKKGENVIKVKVTSPDRSQTKEYVVKIEGTETTYLSDMEWVSGTSGDAGNPIHRDKSCGGNTITLLGTNNQEQQFKKGVGTHAVSEIVVNIEGKGFTKFTAMVGVDRETRQKPSEPNIKFKIVDQNDKVLFTSKEMKFNTPMEKVDLALTPETTQLKFVVNGVRNTWSAHADWADAKFSAEFVEEEYNPEDLPGDLVLESMEVVEDSVKTSYFAGETFDPTGLALNLKYSDGFEQRVVYNDNMAKNFKFDPALDKKLKKGMDKVTVSYTEGEKTLTADIAITVERGTQEDKELAELRKKLQKFYDDCLAYYKEANHSKENWKAYQDAMAAAKKALENEDATIEELQKALDDLVAITKKMNDELKDTGKLEEGKKPPKAPSNVKTGDVALIGLWVLLFALTSALIILIMRRKRRA